MLAPRTSRPAVDVLLVDDDDNARFLVERRARRAGATFAHRVDGVSARQFLEHHAVTLMLLDLRLPDTTGDVLLASLIADGLLDGVHVSVCTSHLPLDAVRDRIVALGATLRVKTEILSGDTLSRLLNEARG